jgi:hypothetical protein
MRLAVITLALSTGCAPAPTLEGPWEGAQDCGSFDGFEIDGELELDVVDLGDGRYEAEYTRDYSVTGEGFWFVATFEGTLELDVDPRTGVGQDIDVDDDCDEFRYEQDILGEVERDSGPCTEDQDFEGEWIATDLVELTFELEDGEDCVFELERR